MNMVVWPRRYYEYGRLAVLMRYDTAEIWKYGYGLTLGISTLNIMASTGVFVRVVFVLPPPPKDGPRERFLRGEATPTENSGRFDKTEYLDD
jgi:hypothetical protein